MGIHRRRRWVGSRARQEQRVRLSPMPTHRPRERNICQHSVDSEAMKMPTTWKMTPRMQR
jgi:hypothetical protein